LSDNYTVDRLRFPRRPERAVQSSIQYPVEGQEESDEGIISAPDLYGADLARGNSQTVEEIPRFRRKSNGGEAQLSSGQAGAEASLKGG